jgi:hypothetical protein
LMTRHQTRNAASNGQQVLPTWQRNIHFDVHSHQCFCGYFMEYWREKPVIPREFLTIPIRVPYDVVSSHLQRSWRFLFLPPAGINRRHALAEHELSPWLHLQQKFYTEAASEVLSVIIGVLLVFVVISCDTWLWLPSGYDCYITVTVRHG